MCEREGHQHTCTGLENVLIFLGVICYFWPDRAQIEHRTHKIDWDFRSELYRMVCYAYVSHTNIAENVNSQAYECMHTVNEWKAMAMRRAANNNNGTAATTTTEMQWKTLDIQRFSFRSVSMVGNCCARTVIDWVGGACIWWMNL